MTFDNYTLVITGLGGQGLIRLLQILGYALVTQGYKVITSETCPYILCCFDKVNGQLSKCV